MSARIVVVGLGLHGTRIAQAAVEQGHRLVAAADPAKAGEELSGAVSGAGVAEGSIAADVEQALAAGACDVAVITAPVDLDGLAALAEPLLARGIDVLTIHPDAFDPPQAWGERIDRAARAGGASFLSTGVQDTWWVHVPAAAAGATKTLRRVRIDHATDLDTLSLGLGRLFGVGEPQAAFARIRDEVLLREASVLGGPLRVLARRLGLTPGEIERSIVPLTAAQPMRWSTGEADVETGRLIGFVEQVRVATEEGVTLEGALRTALLEAGELPTDRVLLEGDPVLHLEHRPFPGDRITDVVPVARIDDIRAAPAGFHTAASMPPASYRHRHPETDS